MLKRNTNQRNLLVLTKNTYYKKHNITQQKQNQKPHPRGPMCLIYWHCAVPEAPRAWHLVHEDFHLHQPRIGVPRCPVGYHSSKSNQGSCLTSELLRERGSKRRKLINLQVRAQNQEPHHTLLFANPWYQRKILRGRWQTYPLRSTPSASCRVSEACPLGPLFHKTPKPKADGLIG